MQEDSSTKNIISDKILVTIYETKSPLAILKGNSKR